MAKDASRVESAGVAHASSIALRDILFAHYYSRDDSIT